MKKWDLGSHAQYQEAKRHAEECWATVPPRPTFIGFFGELHREQYFESKNVKDSFEVISAQDCRFLMMMYAGPVKAVMT